MSFQLKYQKIIRTHIYEIGASALILLATTVRLVLVASGWPIRDADESVMNLEALHIAGRGEHPIFFYGQHYLGVLEAYLGTVLFQLFGPSTQVMRYEMVVFTAGFLVCLYILTSKLYTRAFALIILALFIFGNYGMIKFQIVARGYPELPLFVSLIFLTGYALARGQQVFSVRKRALLYGLWGLLVGMALWLDLLVAPYVLISGILVCVFCWRELRKWAIWWLLLGLLIGGAPMIYYNITAAPGQNSLYAFFGLLGKDPYPNLFFHFIASTLYSLPLALGYSSSCISPQWTTLGLFSGPSSFSCILSTSAWGVSYLLLATLAFLLSLRAFRKLHRVEKSSEQYQQAVLEFARLMLISGFVLSFLSYVKGNGVSNDPLNGWRYLMCTWVSVPAILWPLWNCDQWFHRLWLRRSAIACKLSVLFLLGLSLFITTATIFKESVPAAQASNQHLATLEQSLERMQITRFYSTYWICNPAMMDTHEQLMCGDTSATLEHGFDRYPPYLASVEADPHPGFVYLDGSAQITTLNRYLARYHLKYDRYEIAGYTVYRMYGHISSLDL